MPRSWNAKNREVAIAKAGAGHFDLVIIGGGITGAGIARECALRGLSFCLLDKQDFAFGTSSRSSKLFHGGLRYLASGEFALVREATAERNWLRHHLPNLVRPLAFVYPSYEKGKTRPHTVRLAVKLYDLISDCFSTYKNYRKSRIFKADFIEEIEPAVTMEDPDMGKMTMAGFYYDTNCDDARVTVETIKESLEYSDGLSLALNYARVDGYDHDEHGKVCAVTVTDALNGKRFTVRGKCVVAAVGVWTDEVLAPSAYSEERIYPTKGVHIVVPSERLGNRNAFSLTSLEDGRFFFVLRRGSVSLIGTTDTAYYQESRNLDEPWCTREDCDYLLRTVNRIFPHAMLTDEDIISSYAGIRPLIRQENAGSESDVSRKHEIFETADGIVAIAGGKSTIFRRMGEDLLFYLVGKGKLAPFNNPGQSKKGFSRVPFKVGLTRNEFDRILVEKGLTKVTHPDRLDYLYTQFGRGGLDILSVIREIPESGRPLLPGQPLCAAEIVYILEHENAPKLSDVLCRRTEAQWMIHHKKQPKLATAVSDIMAVYYGWPHEKREAEINEYLRYVNDNVRFLNT